MSELLKMARARDDAELVLRVAAALTLHAQKIEGQQGLNPDSQELVGWLLANPMQKITQAVSYIAANATIRGKMTYKNGVVDSSLVTDDEIIAVIGSSFDAIARAAKKYGIN